MVRPNRPGGSGRALPHATPDPRLGENLEHLLQHGGGSRAVERLWAEYTPHFNGACTGATAIDWSLSPVQYVILTGDVTFTFTNVEDGQTYILILKQDSTGGRAADWGADVRWPNDDPDTVGESEGEIVLSSYAGAIDIITFIGLRDTATDAGDLKLFGVGQIAFG